MGNSTSVSTNPVADSLDFYHVSEQRIATAPRDWLSAGRLVRKKPKPAWRAEQEPEWPQIRAGLDIATTTLKSELHIGLDHHQQLLSETQEAIRNNTDAQSSRRLRRKVQGVKKRIRRMNRALERTGVAATKHDIRLMNEDRKGTLVIESLIREIKGLAAYIRDVEYYQTTTMKMKRYDIEQMAKQSTTQFRQMKLDVPTNMDYEVKRAFEKAKDELTHTLATTRSFRSSGLKPPTIWLPDIASNQGQSLSAMPSGVEEVAMYGSDISDLRDTLSMGYEYQTDGSYEKVRGV